MPANTRSTALINVSCARESVSVVTIAVGSRNVASRIRLLQGHAEPECPSCDLASHTVSKTLRYESANINPPLLLRGSQLSIPRTRLRKRLPPRGSSRSLEKMRENGSTRRRARKAREVLNRQDFDGHADESKWEIDRLGGMCLLSVRHDNLLTVI